MTKDASFPPLLSSSTVGEELLFFSSMFSVLSPNSLAIGVSSFAQNSLLFNFSGTWKANIIVHPSSDRKERFCGIDAPSTMLDAKWLKRHGYKLWISGKYVDDASTKHSFTFQAARSTGARLIKAHYLSYCHYESVTVPLITCLDWKRSVA